MLCDMVIAKALENPLTASVLSHMLGKETKLVFFVSG